MASPPPPQRLPPLNALRMFDAVARRVSFTLAADELGVTQAAVSRQIKRLEEELGVALFERGHRSIALTAPGRRLQRAVRTGFDQIATTVNAIASDRHAQRLTISVSPYFSAAWLMPRLPGFRRLHPAIKVELHHSYDPPDYRREDFDLGINWGRGRWPGIVAEKVMNGAFAPVVAPKMLGGTRLRAPKDLLRFPLLYEFDAADWAAWFQHAGASLPDTARTQRIDDTHALRRAVLDGQGVALFCVALACDDLAAGRLIQPFVTMLDHGNAYFLNYPRRTSTKPTLRKFRHWLAAECGKPPAT